MATPARKQTSFRLNADLLERLHKAAKRVNRSFNSYVESLLWDIVNNEPNEPTLAAIREARSGKCAGTIDTSSMEAFLKSLE